MEETITRTCKPIKVELFALCEGAFDNEKLDNFAFEVHHGK